MSCNSRDDIKTGDLLAWSDYSKEHSTFWLKLVRLATMSEFGHVSVAWRQGEQLFHVEAVMPFIRVVPVPEGESFFYIPMSRFLKTPPRMSEFFSDKIGQRYSVLDAVKAYLGIATQHDNNWQCAELSNAFYAEHGVDLGSKAMTPSRVVYAALDECGASLMRINAIKSCSIGKESNTNG